MTDSLPSSDSPPDAFRLALGIEGAVQLIPSRSRTGNRCGRFSPDTRAPRLRGNPGAAAARPVTQAGQSTRKDRREMSSSWGRPPVKCCTSSTMAVTSSVTTAPRSCGQPPPTARPDTPRGRRSSPRSPHRVEEDVSGGEFELIALENASKVAVSKIPSGTPSASNTGRCLSVCCRAGRDHAGRCVAQLALLDIKHAVEGVTKTPAGVSL
jgi:hypothetical protein